MIEIYNSGLDPYIEFAKSAGALSHDAVRDREARPDVERIRTLFKVADLAIKYGISGAGLASSLGVAIWEADRLIGAHKRVYASYWAWAEAQIDQAYRIGMITTAFGWSMSVDRNTKRNTILNFPQQAACAELLRLALVLMEEEGLGPYLCAAHHDAFYLDCPEDDIAHVRGTVQSCFDEAATVVSSGRVRLRLEIGEVRYPGHYRDPSGGEIWGIVTKHLERTSPQTTQFLITMH